MGLLHLKPYKKKNRLTGLWEIIHPEPIEFKVGVKRGGRNGDPSKSMNHVIEFLKA